MTMLTDGTFAARRNGRDFGMSRWQPGEMLHQICAQAKGGSTTFVAVHSSGHGPRLPTRHAPVHGSYRTNTGKVILALSISASDPKQSSSPEGSAMGESDWLARG